MKKRGASHIEMMLSFVIFVAAIGFALYFFRPGDSTRIVDSSFEYLFREIDENASVRILIYSVKINPENIPEGTTIIGLNLTGSGLVSRSRVFKENTTRLTSKKTDEVVYVSSGSWSGINSLQVVLADEFEDENSPTGTINESYYIASSSLKKKVISEKRIIILNQTYYNNYSQLKKQFNIPNRVNFGFAFNFSDGSTIKSEREIPKELEVFINNKRVEVIRETGEIVFADLKVEIW